MKEDSVLAQSGNQQDAEMDINIELSDTLHHVTQPATWHFV